MNPYHFDSMEAKLNVFWETNNVKYVSSVPCSPKIGHLKLSIKRTKEYHGIEEDTEIKIYSALRSIPAILEDSVVIDWKIGGTLDKPFVVM